MKSSGKPAGRYGNLSNVHPSIEQNRKCIKPNCGKWFKCVSYKISPVDYFCGKHKKEFREQEAENIMEKYND
jgi:hypothetical protein